MPVPGAPSVERNMDLTWNGSEVGDYLRCMSEMEVYYALSDGVVGNMSIRRCD
jgi:hypothetical protein